MATKKQKREAGERKQAEALAKVTAERLATQKRDQDRRAEKEAELKAEAQRINARHERILDQTSPSLPIEFAIVRQLQISRSISERPWA